MSIPPYDEKTRPKVWCAECGKRGPEVTLYSPWVCESCKERNALMKKIRRKLRERREK